MPTAPVPPMVRTRSGEEAATEPFEKPVILPAAGDNDPARHAWADARFTTDIMAEHGLFFALLMRPEVSGKERTQALRFAETFAALHQRIAAAKPPDRGELRRFCGQVIEQLKPFIDDKQTMGDAQRNGRLRSLVWPLFFDHTRHQAERWTTAVAAGQRGVGTGTHRGRRLLGHHHGGARPLRRPPAGPRRGRTHRTGDPHQQGLRQVRRWWSGWGAVALAAQPGAVAKALTQHPETSAVLSAAETILAFKTQAARDIQAGRIKSIIDPRLADHVRREALKFVDELRRVV